MSILRDMVERTVLSPEKRELKANLTQIRQYQQDFRDLAKAGYQTAQEDEFEAASEQFELARGKVHSAQRLIDITQQRADAAGMDEATEKVDILDEFFELADAYIREYQLACEAGLEQDHAAMEEHHENALDVQADLKQLLEDHT